MKIMYILAGLGAGGAERVVALIAHARAERGDDVSIIAFDAPTDACYHEIHPAVKLVRLDIPAGGGNLVRGIVASLKRMRALRRLMKVERPDVAVSFLTKISVIAVMAAERLGIPVIISERNNPTKQRANPFWAWAWRHAADRAAGIVLQTDAIRRIYPRAIADRAFVIHNPIELPPLTPERHDGLVLAAAGRLDQQKGFDILIPAFARIAADFPDWTLKIWGEGSARASLLAQIDALGMGERIQLPGTSPRPCSWIETADAFVLSSRFEGFANVLAEAMRAGLPCVATSCDFGPPEIITDGLDGLLVTPEDEDALVEGMRRLLGDSGLRRRFGIAARVSSMRFLPERIVQNWDSALHKILYSA